MEIGDVGSAAKLEKQLYQIYRDFMTRVTKLDELVAAGNSFLASFQQGLEFLRRPLLDRRSELFESIVKANETSRLNAYLDGGCFMNNHTKENLVKRMARYDYIIYNAINVGCILHRKLTVLAEPLIQFSFSWIVCLCCREVQTCLQGLLEHLNEAKTLLSEMKSFLELATTTIEALNELSSAGYLLSSQECITDQGEEHVSSASQKHAQMEHTPLMASVYAMMKQDHAMQEKIVSALNMEVLSEELGSYCMMWSLRPYINDEMMQEAWKLVK